jgi:large subunit ribosomal protein L21
MYAIIDNGGKQYKVEVGKTIKFEGGPYEQGVAISIDRVLAIVDGANTICGTPYVTGAKVLAEAVGNGKSKKVLVYKQRPRKVYRKIRGHRQPFTILKINDIHLEVDNGP